MKIKNAINTSLTFAFAAALILSLFVFTGDELPMFTADEKAQNLTGITYETAIGVGDIVLPATLKNLPPKTPVTLYAQIPPGQNSLLIKSVFAKTKLYLNDTLVYEFGRDGSYPAFMNDPPTGLAVVPLPENARGVSLRLEYLSPSQRNELSLPAMYTGSEGALIAMLFRSNGFSLLFSFTLIFIGAAMGVISLVFVRKMAGGMSFLWLGFFSLSAGIWILGECDLSALLIPYPSLLYAMAYLGLFSLTIPFLRFGLVILKPKNRLPIFVMLYTHRIALTAALVLQLTGTVDLMKTLYLFHIIAPLAFIVFAADLLWEYFRYSNGSAKRFAPAVILLAVSVVLELINYWLKLAGTFTVMFQIGVLCFIVTLGIESGRTMRETMRAADDNAALDRLNRMKADLIATITHETMTPLAVLSVYSELIARELRKKGVDEQTAKDLDAISDETQRIKRLMDELRNHTREKENNLLKTRLNLTELAGNAARLYTPIMERKENTLIVRFPDDLPDIYACANEVTQMLFNLLQNSHNHTENGEVVITSEADGDYVRVTVSDTGSGIPPELLSRVFGRGVSGSKNGTGLGLFICREIIETHGGSINIESGPGEGTRVWFTLPVWKGETRE